MCVLFYITDGNVCDVRLVVWLLRQSIKKNKRRSIEVQEIVLSLMPST